MEVINIGAGFGSIAAAIEMTRHGHQNTTISKPPRNYPHTASWPWRHVTGELRPLDDNALLG
jgi:glycine/D-amino acid oxidase-like deaminating enzyme